MLARPKKKWSKPVSETRNWRKTIDLTEVYTTTGSRDDYSATLPFLSQSHALNGTSSMYEGYMADSASLAFTASYVAHEGIISGSLGGIVNDFG